MTDRFDQLSPRDTAITLRSLGRRINDAANQALQDPEGASLVDASGPDGQSLSATIDDAARVQAFLRNELAKALDHENPVVSAAISDHSLRTFVEERAVPVAVGLQSLSEDTSLSAERLEDASTEALARPIAVVGGMSTTVLDIARESARSGIATLGAVTATVEWIRVKRR